MAWLDVKTGYFEYNEATKKNKLIPIEKWEDDLEALVDTLKFMGLWDTIAGFIWDEPLHSRIPVEDFYKHSKYLKEKYNKRNFAVFYLTAFDPGVDPGRGIDIITPQTGAYITDIGFDAYGVSNPEKYRAYNEKMKAAVGRTHEVKVWFVPCAFEEIYSGKDEAYALNHLNICYDLLKEEKNPGGIFAYSYPTWGKEIGLVDTLRDGRFTNFGKRLKDIGKELIHTRMK